MYVLNFKSIYHTIIHNLYSKVMPFYFKPQVSCQFRNTSMNFSYTCQSCCHLLNQLTIQLIILQLLLMGHRLFYSFFVKINTGIYSLINDKIQLAPGNQDNIMAMIWYISVYLYCPVFVSKSLQKFLLKIANQGITYKLHKFKVFARYLTITSSF